MTSRNIDDRLSRLPEEIVSHILSLMPTRFAVQTCILSKRWRYSWMYVTNLDLDDKHVPSFLDRYMLFYFNFESNIQSILDDSHYLDNFTKYVERVLGFCKSSQVKLFRLHLLNLAVQKSSVSKWIDKAVRLNVCELDIQLILKELPLNLFTCKTLTKLRIDFAASDCTILDDPCPVNLPCLKTLDIVCNNPFVNAFKLIRGSPILECLFLVVRWFDDEDDFIFNIPTLKRLKLTLTCREPTSFCNKAVLNVPNLEYLFVGGDLCSFFVMENVSSLVEASVSFNDLKFDHRWLELLKGLNGVKSFSAENKSLLYMKTPVFSRSSWPIFPNMKRLELKGFRDSGLIPQFLESCPQLKHLCIEKVDGRLCKREKLAESSWIEPRLVPACMVTNLTTIKLSKFIGKICDVEFLDYMLKNAAVLESLTIVWENLCFEETRFCEWLLAVPRASRHCEIHFRGNGSPSQLAFVN